MIRTLVVHLLLRSWLEDDLRAEHQAAAAYPRVRWVSGVASAQVEKGVAERASRIEVA